MGRHLPFFMAKAPETAMDADLIDRAEGLAPRIVAGSLVLRSLAAADRERIVTLASDARVSRFTARIPHPYPPGAADAFLDYAARSLIDGSETALAIAEALQPGDLIGAAGWERPHDGRCEIGYWLGHQYWGRGYGTDVIRAVAAHLFERGDVTVLTAGIFPDNRASARVLEKAGFALVGTCDCATPARDTACVTADLYELPRPREAARSRREAS